MASAQAGGTPSVTVETGTGYTLEVYALVDQANQNNRSFAKSYKGVSAPFDLTAAGVSVSVSLSMYEAAPVEVVYGNAASPYTISGVGFDEAGEFGGLDFDRYGRLLINSSSGGSTILYVVEKGGSTSEEYVLSSGGSDIAYNALTNSVFTVDNGGSNIYRYDLASQNVPVNTLVAPNMSSGETAAAIAIDSAGGIYYVVNSAPTAGEQTVQIRKASLSGQNLSPDESSFSPPSITKPTSDSLEVKDIKAVMGRVAVVTQVMRQVGTMQVSDLRVSMYDAASGAKTGETLSIPTGYGYGGLHFITGWDEGGVWLYTQYYDINNSFVDDEHYYIAWNGAGISPDPGVTSQYRIGDTGPAGGLIFYDKGVFTNGWRYLEAAPKEAEFELEFDGAGNVIGPRWGANGQNVTGTETGTGIGKENTRIIVEYLNGSPDPGLPNTECAAYICDDMELNGFTDWFLPSKDELDLMYKNLCAQGLGGFNTTNTANQPWLSYYWSSSQYSNTSAYVLDFSNGSQKTNVNKSDTYSVRAIRAF